jgi:hypothetical protein
MASIELPDFMTDRMVEQFYRLIISGSERGSHTPHQERRNNRGLRMARDRNPKLLLFLEKSAEVLRRANETQQDRFAEGVQQDVRVNGEVVDRLHACFPKQDFSEYATVRTAYTVCDGYKEEDYTMIAVFQNVYAAAADCILGEL